jgi:hypothetical protein
MSRARSSWGETVALILRDCEPEVRLEFMRVLGQWKQISMNCIRENSRTDKQTFDADRVAAEQRMVKLTALEEHLQREMEFDAAMNAMFAQMWRGL